MSDSRIRRFVLVLILLFAVGSPAFAEAAGRPRAVVELRTAPLAVVLADGPGIGKFFYGGGRTRIVQICAVVMSIALFIMMRKLQ